MLPPTLISALQVLSRSGKPLITSDTPPPSATKLEPGQQVQGTVQAQVSPGLYKVLVAGQNVQMRLPADLRSGTLINLRVVSNKPQLTFSIIPSATPISTQEQIGPTARMLAHLTEAPLEKPVTRQTGNSPVWQTTGSVPDSKQLAGALRSALANSGLFYESHQAQWVLGERSTAQLLVEPQNQLGITGISMPQPEHQPSSAAASGPALVQQDLALATNTTATSPASASNSNMHHDGAIAKELLPLVQQQLHTLETHQLTWSGQVWPGQEMQWEIQGQPEHHAEQQDERKWSTEMELALPILGDVHARMVFSAHGLQLTLHAADGETVALLNHALPRLRSALAEVDVPLVAAVVERS